MTIFCSEDGGSTFLRDVRIFLTHYVASHPKRHFASHIIKVILPKKKKKCMECEMRYAHWVSVGNYERESYLGDINMNKRTILKWILKPGIWSSRINLTWHG
jgi:hypothetical protein